MNPISRLSSLVVCTYLFGATAVIAQQQLPLSQDLSVPALKFHASIPQNTLGGGQAFDAVLSEAKPLAASKGLPWSGVDAVLSDGMGDINGFDVINFYKKLSCESRIMVIGHITEAASHLTASNNNAVYTDYLFDVDSFFLNNKQLPFKSLSRIIVTRPGGSIKLNLGPVKYQSMAFPELLKNTTYLIFLRYLPASGAFQAFDAFSTFSLSGDNWKFTRGALSRFTSPELSKSVFIGNIQQWMSACQN